MNFSSVYGIVLEKNTLIDNFSICYLRGIVIYNYTQEQIPLLDMIPLICTSSLSVLS